MANNIFFDCIMLRKYAGTFGFEENQVFIKIF